MFTAEDRELLDRIDAAGLGATGALVAHLLWAISTNPEGMPGATVSVDWDVTLPALAVMFPAGV